MNWNGEYRIRCPKCGCRKIWVTEHTDAISEHLVDNGEWKHEYDNNDYAEILYTDFCCDSCGHKWRRHLTTIDSYIFDEKQERKDKKEQKRINQMNDTALFWKIINKNHK